MAKAPGSKSILPVVPQQQTPAPFASSTNQHGQPGLAAGRREIELEQAELRKREASSATVAPRLQEKRPRVESGNEYQ
jgi:hypothetical protein